MRHLLGLVETQPPVIIVVSAVIAATLALICAFFVLCSVTLHRRLQTVTFRLLLWYTIFDSIVAFSILFGPVGKLNGIITQRCAFQAAAIQFGIVAGLLWNLVFCIHLLRITARNAKTKYTHSILSYVVYIALAIVPAALVTRRMFVDGHVGVSGDFWCWIRESDLHNFDWKYLYLFVIITVIVCIIMYLYIKIRVQSLHDYTLENVAESRSRNDFLQVVQSGLSSYLATPFVAFVPAHLNYFCALLGKESWDHVVSWYILSACLNGILHGLLFLTIFLVCDSWSVACCNQRSKRRDLENSELYFMKLI